MTLTVRLNPRVLDLGNFHPSESYSSVGSLSLCFALFARSFLGKSTTTGGGGGRQGIPWAFAFDDAESTCQIGRAFHYDLDQSASDTTEGIEVILHEGKVIKSTQLSRDPWHRTAGKMSSPTIDYANRAQAPGHSYRGLKRDIHFT